MKIPQQHSQEGFRDRVVWITGASSGIGEELAYAFAKSGSKLILSARNEAALYRVKADPRLRGKDVFVLPLDLADPRQLGKKASLALEKWGRIDYLIHNAAQAARETAVEAPQWLDRVIMEVNYFAPVALTKAVLPSMMRRGAGHIVVISSLSGKFGAPKLSAYAASKHALHGFFGSLRTELAHKPVRISVIVPGFINTPIIKNALDKEGTKRMKNLEVNEKGMPAATCATRILRAIRKGKYETLIGGIEIAGVYLHRFLPGVFHQVISNHPVKRFQQALRLFIKAIPFINQV